MSDRKRSHGRWNNSVKQKCVEAGLSGLFITCDGQEKQSIAEAYNLIDSILDNQPSDDKQVDADESADSNDEDVADSIKRICNDTRETKSKARRCKQRPTGVKNCLFVTVNGADIVDLAEKLVVKAQGAPCCRHLQRVLPVEETATIDLKKLSEMITSCVSRHLKAKEDGSYPSYALEFKTRNNDTVKKTEVLEMLNDAINAIAPSAKVDLSGAEVLFYVQVVRKTLMRRIYHWSASSSHRLNNWESSPAPVLSDPPEIHNRRRFYAETQPRPITQGVSSGLIWNPAPIPRMEYESFDDECPSTSTSVKLNSLPSLVSSTFYNNDSNGTQNQQSALDSYCFYDQGHPMGLISQLAELRSDNTMCDVELVVDGCSIMAHKCVLAAAIPYFRIMFTGAMIESRKNRITINDIEYEALKALVDFVYTSSIRINSENVQNILFAASILQMDNVCGACQQFLSRFLTTNNCLSIRQFAEIHNCTDLLGSTEAFAIDHFSELRKNDEFLHIPFNHLESLIKREDLLIKKENEVFDAIVSWVDCKPDERKKHFFDLISHLRWSQMSIRFLKTIVKQNNYINEDFRCKELVSEAALEMLTSQDLLVPLPQKVINQENGDQYAASSSTNEPINISKPFHNRIAPRKSLAGVIFCAGGRGTVGVPFRTVEAYDWRKNSWIAVPEMIQQRRHVGVVSAQGKLYAIGGHDGHVHLDSAEVFDPEIGVWRSIAPMHTSRRGIAVTGLDGAIYAVGGLDDHTCFPTVERYDIELDQWTEVAHMCSHRGGVGVTAFRNYLFAIGGNDGTHSLNSCERYDPLLNKWKMIKSMCNRRAGAGVSVLNGFLYAVGGFDDNAPLATCERYNVITDTWESLDNMSCPRGGVGVASMGGLLYAIGGHDGVKYLNTVECYDPYLNRWSPVADIKECRAGAGVAWADVRIDDIQPRQMDSVCGPFGAGQCI